MAYVDIPTPEHGTVTVLRNGQPNPGYPISAYTKRYDFAMWDAFSFEAHPDAGYEFVRFCGDPPCSFSTTYNPFREKISAEAGYISAIFREQAVTKGYVDGEIKKLGDRIAAVEKALGTQIMEVLVSLQDIVERAEQEATAWRAGLADLFERVKSWIAENVLLLFLSHADVAAEKVTANYTGTIPEGPDWNRTSEEENASKVTFPLDPERVKRLSNEIGKMREGRWDLNREKM